MEYYDKTYDRVTTKNERPLKRINRIFHKVTTTDDPMIRQVCYAIYLGPCAVMVGGWIYDLRDRHLLLVSVICFELAF